jgi:DNA-binding SARP family transcriptional activator
VAGSEDDRVTGTAAHDAGGPGGQPGCELPDGTDGSDGSNGVAVSVLGPLRVTVDGRPVAVTAGRLRVLLAVLAMAAGQPLPIDRLAAAVWDREPPGDARRCLRTYVTRLRHALGAASISARPGGYVLCTEPDRVDALRFGRLLDAAAAASDLDTRRDHLDQALGLWRGEPFEDLRSEWLARTEVPRLAERYLVAVERRIDLDLAAGRADALVAPLRELTARHPLRESLWARLLATLQRCGRPVEALEAYEETRRRIAADMGVEPGPQLQGIYATLLAGTTPERTGAVARPAGSRVVPRQLPNDIADFDDRQSRLDHLDALIRAGDDTTAPPTVIVTISGAARTGKTTLAVHWAHGVAKHFPDGQLYTDLRGSDPVDAPQRPAETVRLFLNALCVPPSQIPFDVDAQVALYRSLLAGNRMLLVLDDARDADHVRPVLPGAPGCLVIVTSRDPLTSLVAIEAAHPVILDLPATGEDRRRPARRRSANAPLHQAQTR